MEVVAPECSRLFGICLFHERQITLPNANQFQFAFKRTSVISRGDLMGSIALLTVEIFGKNSVLRMLNLTMSVSPFWTEHASS